MKVFFGAGIERVKAVDVIELWGNFQSGVDFKEKELNHLKLSA